MVGTCNFNGQSSNGHTSYMHVLVPNETRLYDVIVEDTYDGLPPISCLEHELLMEVEDGEDWDEEEDGEADDEGPESAEDAVEMQEMQVDPGTPAVRPTAPMEAVQPDSALLCGASESHELINCRRTDSGLEEGDRIVKKARAEEIGAEEAQFGVLHACNGTLGNKPSKGSYACKGPGCTRKFGRGSDLERHWRSVHLKTMWKCLAAECADREEFSRKDSLFRHISMAHKEDGDRLKALYNRKKREANSSLS